ncbi:MAG: UDP-N-acetylmuramate--L-alanine ligase [Clostridiaceae bacterium]|nr:UDP-N-acetylmuramate--L-alanine ligase [Clostridiaceae bacterium]
MIESTKSGSSDNNERTFNPEPGSRIFFVGIGGISMCGLAELAMHYGYPVSGSDKHLPPRVSRLTEQGATLYRTHDKSNIISFSPDVLVHTAAILPGNPEIEYAKEIGIPIVSRAEFLGWLTRKFSKVINISGTHGKTTVTSMLAMIMIEDQKDPTVHIGAEFQEFNSTVRAGADFSLLISEACEYQKSFLEFRSSTAAITNIDFDHVDCYRNIDELIDVFAIFTENIDNDGTLVIPAHDHCVAATVTQMIKSRMSRSIPVPRIITTGLSDDRFLLDNSKPDIYADRIEYIDGLPAFDLWIFGELQGRIFLRVPGRHNIYNALTASASAYANNASIDSIIRALNHFSGAEGRYNVKGTYHGATVVTDYAHHPAAAQATLQAASMMPHNNTWVVFQPLTYNRTKILFDDYVRVLKTCRHIIFSEIFSDREVNPGDISSSMIADQINNSDGHAEFYPMKADIINRLNELVGPNDLVLILGPEDIRELADELIKTP